MLNCLIRSGIVFHSLSLWETRLIWDLTNTLFFPFNQHSTGKNVLFSCLLNNTLCFAAFTALKLKQTKKALSAHVWYMWRWMCLRAQLGPVTRRTKITEVLLKPEGTAPCCWLVFVATLTQFGCYKVPFCTANATDKAAPICCVTVWLNSKHQLNLCQAQTDRDLLSRLAVLSARRQTITQAALSSTWKCLLEVSLWS